MQTITEKAEQLKAKITDLHLDLLNCDDETEKMYLEEDIKHAEHKLSLIQKQLS